MGSKTDTAHNQRLVPWAYCNLGSPKSSLCISEHAAPRVQSLIQYVALETHRNWYTTPPPHTHTMTRTYTYIPTHIQGKITSSVAKNVHIGLKEPTYGGMQLAVFK